MKKALIISYHSLPMDVIASYRAMAYLRYFKEFDINPTLLTHPWSKSIDSKDAELESFSFGEIIRVLIKQHKRSKVLQILESLPIINKLSILTRWMSGILDDKIRDHNSYLSLKRYCFRELDVKSFDVVIGIFSPHHHLKLCYELHQKFEIPYILDFRDLWHNRVIHRHYQPNITEKIQDKITKYYWSKWLSKALFFSITSDEWRDKICEFTPVKGVVINNGFDRALFDETTSNKTSDVFTIVHGGSLYSHQKLDIFLIGCKNFIEEIAPSDFKVKFIGAQKSKGLPNQLSGFLYEPKKKIHDILNEKYCDVTKRIPKIELAEEIVNCQLLFFPGLPDSPGTHLGKIFDYLVSGKNILMVPDDDSVVGELIRETNTGYICNTSQEVCQKLTECYKEWQKNNQLSYNGNVSAINKYSRESQVKKSAFFINEYLD